MTVSLCMLVKNEEAGIQRAIDSVRAVVNEVVIVDDASTDRTVELALACGARVVQLPRPVSETGFAVAVNFMLDQCTMEWALFLDGDEFLEKVDFHPLMRYADKTVWGLPRRKWSNYAKGKRTELEAYPDFQPKLLKNLAHNRFEGEMHIQWKGDQVSYAWRGPHIEHLQDEMRTPFKLQQRGALYDELATKQGVTVVGGHKLPKSE